MKDHSDFCLKNGLEEEQGIPVRTVVHRDGGRAGGGGQEGNKWECSRDKCQELEQMVLDGLGEGFEGEGSIKDDSGFLTEAMGQMMNRVSAT